MYSSIVYIFSKTSISIIYKTKQNNSEEERRSGTTGTGVSQKDLQINEKNRKKETLIRLSEKACSGGSDKLYIAN